jgi:predicted Zn finger-like uncharacterized protein
MLASNGAPMLRREDEPIELVCPECSARFKVAAKQADRGKVRCPRGHEVPVVGILGGPEQPR